MAIWEKWSPVAPMQRVVEDATQRIAKATRKWAVVYGPGAALILTCTRLRWRILSATKLVTDLGEQLDLLLDPPRVVVMHCFAAVQRWRWRRVEETMPQLAANGAGRGPIMEPIWQLLRTKTKEVGWSAAHKGCLRSIIPNRQYPQARVKNCGWATHDRCLFCLSDLVDAESPHSGVQQQQQRQQDVQTQPVNSSQVLLDEAKKIDFFLLLIVCSSSSSSSSSLPGIFPQAIGCILSSRSPSSTVH